MPAKYVVSVVGPIYYDGTKNKEDLLYNTYQNALKLAVEKDIKSVAFTQIYAGAYGYPIKEAIRVAITAINDFLTNHNIDVTLVFFDQATFKHLIDPHLINK